MKSTLVEKASLLCWRILRKGTYLKHWKRLRGTPASKLPEELLSGINLLLAMENRKIQTIYDIGAHVGNWSLMARSIFPNARIDAFEPMPQSQKAFEAASPAIGNAFLHKYALGPTKGEAEMVIAGNDADSSSLLKPSDDGLKLMSTKVSGVQKVRIEKLDEVVARNDAPFPDYIKMDVQGFELEVLRGATECLKHATAVQCEVSFIGFYEKQASFKDILSFMDDQGYRLYMFDNFNPRLPFTQLDALFVKKNKNGPEKDL